MDAPTAFMTLQNRVSVYSIQYMGNLHGVSQAMVEVCIKNKLGEHLTAHLHIFVLSSSAFFVFVLNKRLRERLLYRIAIESFIYF